MALWDTVMARPDLVHIYGQYENQRKFDHVSFEIFTSFISSLWNGKEVTS